MITVLSIVLILMAVATLIGRNKVNATGIFCLYFGIGVVIPYLSGILNPNPTDLFSSFASAPEARVAFFYLSLGFFLTLAASRISFQINGNSRYCWKMEPSNELASKLSTIAYVLAAIALVGTIVGQGGLQNAYEAAFLRAKREGSSLLNYLAFPFWGAIVFATFSWYATERSTATILLKAKVLTLVMFCAGLCFLNGGRSVVILFVVSLFMHPLLSSSKKRLLTLVLVGLPFIGIVSYLMIILRYTAQDAQILDQGGLTLFSVATTGLAYLDHFVISMHYTEFAGHDAGGLYLNAALSFIPRSLWPEKPLETAVLLREFLFGDTTGGVPPGLFGEGFIAAGFFGVIVISILYGLLLGAVDAVARKGALISSPFHYTIAGVFVPLLGFTLVRGGIELSVFRIGIPAFMALCAWIYATRQCRPSCYFITTTVQPTNVAQTLFARSLDIRAFSTQPAENR